METDMQHLAQVAELLAPSAAEFLANKHGVTVAVIAEALAAGNGKIAEQMAALVCAVLASVAAVYTPGMDRDEVRALLAQHIAVAA
jgi:hypothetical protein